MGENYVPLSVNEQYIKGKQSLEFKILMPGNGVDGFIYALYLDGKAYKSQKDHIIHIPLSKNFFKTIRIKIAFGNDTWKIINARSDIKSITYQRVNRKSNFFEITIPLEGYMFHGITVNDTLMIDNDELYWKKFGTFEKYLE